MRRQCRIAVQAALASLALLGSSLSQAGSLILAVADIPYSAPVLIAEAEGYFKEEGLSLQVQHVSLGRTAMEKLLAGQAHFATVADVPITMSGFTRKDFAVVGTITVTGRENQLVVRNDRGIQEPADLQGKRLGVVFGTSGHYFADTFQLFHGLKLGAVNEVPIDPKDRTGALVRGDVDAAVLFGTHVSEAMQQLGSRARVMPGPAFFSLTFNIVSRLPAAGVKDEDTVKLLKAVRRANAFIQRDPVAARRIVSRALKIDPAELEGVWNDFDFRLQLAQPLLTTLEAQARWALRRKLVPPGSVPDYLELIRTEPLSRVDARAVLIVK
jgi:NitT/TauT family transport system substrate-binding protein